MFGFSFAPRGWAFCNGQILPISSNQALFSLLGIVYGGDGRTTFILPDLQGRCPINQGPGPGLTSRNLGSKAGVERVTLTGNEIPSHAHSLSGGSIATTSAVGNQTIPNGNKLAKANDGESNYSDAESNGTMALSGNTANAGGSQSHENMPPFLTINFCIAMVGIYPSRS